MNAGLTDLAVTSLALDAQAGVLHAGTESGVFEISIPRAARLVPPR